MGRPSSEPPEPDEPQPARAPAAAAARVLEPTWLQDVLPESSLLVSSVLPRSARPQRVSGRAGQATIVHSGVPQAPALGSGVAGLVDLMKVGKEAPGRYQYCSPD